MKWFVLLAILALLPSAEARDWGLSRSTLDRSREVRKLTLVRVPPVATIPVDRDHQADTFDIGFTVPIENPSFLVLTTRASRRGRLTVHLQPAELPAVLRDAVPQDDWANPHRLYDFRSVVELHPGAGEEHLLSLNRDFFEAVTRIKRPFDLAGIRIDRMAFHLSVPVEHGQSLELVRVRIVELTGPAMKRHLSDLVNAAASRWKELPGGSPLRVFWEPAIRAAEEKVQTFSKLTSPSARDWWVAVEEMEQLRFKSRLWGSATASSDALQVGTVSSLIRVSGRHERLAMEFPFQAVTQLEAAANEYESFQIVLMAPGPGVSGISVEAADLKTVDGQARIPATAVEFFEQIEQYVKPSPGTAQSQVGWLPDALMPVRGTLSVGSGETKPLWVTVKVPEGTPSGVYSGKLRIMVESGQVFLAGVELRVHDFSIPITGRFRTQGHFDLDGLKEWYGDLEFAPLRKAFYRLLMEHRFSPTSQYSPRLSPEKEDIPWLLEAGANVLLVGGFSGGPLDPAIIDPAYRWLVDQGLIDMAVIYIGDETDDFEGIRAKSREIRKKWPRLRIMVGGSKPREELVGYVDVWDPITFGGLTYNFEPDSVRQATQRGEEVFWYTCVGPRAPFANIYNDHPLTAIRALWWQAWKYGVTGFEYWWFNWWRSNLALSRGDAPWPLSRRAAWDSRAYDWSNGDGLLVFPGPAGQPLPSLRLSVVRDAIEDWEVLFLLARAVEMAAADASADRTALIQEAQAMLAVPPGITTDLTHWNEDPGVYWQARKRVYSALSGLRASLGKDALDRYVREWDRQHQVWLNRKFEERIQATGN